MSNAERFNHRCPYTDKPCLDFACSECEVEAQEVRWMEELQGESRIIAEDTDLNDVDAIGLYEDDLQNIKRELWDCGVNMGGEYQGVWVRFKDIERIIDKYTKGNAPHTSQN